jgi:hypothetical protein
MQLYHYSWNKTLELSSTLSFGENYKNLDYHNKSHNALILGHPHPLLTYCSFFSRCFIKQKKMLMKICKCKWLPFTSNQNVICNKWFYKKKSQ